MVNGKKYYILDIKIDGEHNGSSIYSAEDQARSGMKERFSTFFKDCQVSPNISINRSYIGIDSAYIEIITSGKIVRLDFKVHSGCFVA